jgi:streptomycin 6-kinase
MHVRMLLPESLRKLAHLPEGERWLGRLPRLIGDLSGKWQLRLGEPYPGSNVSYVAPAVRAGEQVVLKIQWPHDESTHEADALRIWDGDGAVRLLEHDAERHALLLEQCSPGTSLSSTPNIDQLAVLSELLPRLWKPVRRPFQFLSDEARHWSRSLPADWEAAGKPCERELVDAGVTSIAELLCAQGQQVLLHQDLHGENVLAAKREPWLVIDPKPLAGEREFALAPIIRSFEFGHSREKVLGRLDRLSSTLQLDRNRARRWTIAQTMAWSFDSAYAERHFETVRWLIAAG